MWGWAVLCGALLFVYVRLTSNKSIVDVNKRFTHADVTTGYKTETYEIVKYDYICKEHLNQVKIWPDRSINPDWPEFVQASSSSVKLYTK